MSDTIDATAPASTDAAGQRDPTSPGEASVQSFRARDLTRLAQGFYFIFWGSLAVLSVIAETLGTSTFRMYALATGGSEPFRRMLLEVYSLVVGSTGVLGVLAGSWRLYQTRDLGRAWRRLTRLLLLVAILIAYLFPFCWMWRGVPTNLYLLCHALAWGGLLICHISLLSVVVGALARLAGRPSLAVQAVLYGAGCFTVLFVPFAELAYSLIAVTRRGDDPLAAVVYLLGSIHSIYVLIALVPVSLSLSLAWTAKDIVLQRLSMRDSENVTDQKPHE